MKICGLCHKEIDTKNHKYIHLEDWYKNKMIKDIWCHLVCFNKGMNRELTDLEKQAKIMLEKAGGLMNMFPISEQTKEYSIQ